MIILGFTFFTLFSSFQIQLTTNTEMFYIILRVTGFEPPTSGSGSRRSATLATPRLGQVWLKIKPVSLVPCQGELKSWSSVFAFVIKYSGR